MNQYFAWSLRQFYLLVFQPSVFRLEVEGEGANEPKLQYVGRIVYLLKLLPWIAAFAGLGNITSGLIYQAFGRHYTWIPSWLGIFLGIAAGAAFGSALRSSATIVGGIAGGVVLGVVGGVAVGSLVRVWIYLTIGVFAGPVVGILLGLIFRPREAREPVPVSLLSASAGLALAVGIFVPIADGQVPIDIYNGLAVCLGAAVAGGVASGIGSAAVFGLNGGARYALSLGVLLGFAGALAFGISGTFIFGGDLGIPLGAAFFVAFPLTLWSTYFRLINYPVNVLVAIVSYSVARQYPNSAIRAWLFYPVTWDEVTWLPLPYLSKFLLLLLKQDRIYGFKQISFISTQRTLQREAVFTTISELVVNDLNALSLSELTETSGRLSWSTEERVYLPPGLISALTNFDRIAQHAKQYQTLHSLYRKNAVLENAAGEIELLRRSLIANRDPIAPRLLYIAEQWTQLISKEQDRLTARGVASKGIMNPFVPGEPLGERFDYAFAGRQDIVWKIEESMLGRMQTPTLLLYGPRRMGKTSILEQLPRLLGPEFAPIFIDCQNPAVSSATSSVSTWLRYLSVEIAKGLRRRRVVIEPLKELALEREPFAVFDKWLDLIENTLPKDIRVLLCLDEYESLQKILKVAWGEEFLDGLRHLIQHRPFVALMFCGAHTFAESGPEWTSRFINARVLRVSFLTFDEVVPLLTKPVPEFDLVYGQGVLEELFEMTRGQPYLTQLVASELVELLNEEHRKEASREDIREAVSRALVSGSEYFFNLWYDAGEKGQAILRAVAKGEPPPHFAAAKEWLQRHEVLDDSGAFAVPMVERWVKERLPETA